MILDYAVRISISFLCGMCLGLERKSRQQTVGIRTLVLISVSCTLLSILSQYLAACGAVTGDPTRIASTVVTGIGFIGGGAILRQGFNVRGITTAAIIFTAAAIGLSCGAKLYIPAILTLLVAVFALYAMSLLEHKLFPAAKTKLLQMTLNGTEFDQDKLCSIMKVNGLIIHDLNIEYSAEKNQTTLKYIVKTPDSLNAVNLANELRKVEKLINFSLADR